MPEISRFLGIIIRMYLREHAPPHFHAEYGEYEITVDIKTGIVTGRFPRRALNAVLDWYLLHQNQRGKSKGSDSIDFKSKGSDSIDF